MHERIAFARKQSGLNQSRIATVIGVSRESISQWESGKTEPTRENLAKFSKATNAPIGWLLSDDSELAGEGWGEARPKIASAGIGEPDPLEPFRIAIESLANALLPRVPGAASAFLIDLNASLRGRKVPADEDLPGTLKGIAETSRADAARAYQDSGRDGSARHTKRGS